ncbi:MAG: CheR family methyltransferase [Steroidobacter sp.]
MTPQEASGPPPGSGQDPQIREMGALLEAVYDRSGVDFRDYAHSSLRRRIDRCVAEENVAAIPDLHQRVLDDDACLHRVILRLTLPVTSMFRDPQFFRQFRERAAPMLRTHPFLRVWVAGCSTGQELWSLAILLHEEGLYERARIYATDLHPAVLARAQEGVYPLSLMQDYTRNYQAAGGRGEFSTYYTADADAVVMRSLLRSNIVFGVHNLVSDGSFNEFQVIFCRNVMIYFNRSLQRRVHTLLYESLAPFGYMGLGRSESVRFSPHEEHYEAICPRERLYRKIG